MRKIAAALLAIPALWHVVLFVRIVSARATYPSDIEWLEGAHLYQAMRLTTGQAVYAAPADGYCPLPYPPVYFALVGGIGKIFGMDYWVGRLVGVAFLAAACIAIAWEVARHAPRRNAFDAVLGLSTASCVLAAYPLVEGFYDLVRTDTMAVSLIVLAAIGLTAKPMETARALAIGLLLTLSLFTKHTYAPIVLFMIAFAVVRDWRSGVVIALAAAGASAIMWFAMQTHTHGWFGTWLGVTGGHMVRAEELSHVTRAIVGFAPYLLAVPLVVMVLLIRKRLSPRAVLWLGMTCAALPVCVLGFAKVSGSWNNVIPVVMLAPPAAALALRDLVRAPLVAAAAALYLVCRTYDPAPYVPTEERIANARALNETIARLDGDVVMPERPFLPIRNGHRGTTQLNMMGYADAGNSKMEGFSYVHDLERTQAKWVILADPEERWLRDQTLELYDYDRDLDVTVATFATLHSKPHALYRKKSPGGKSPGAKSPGAK